MQDISLRRATIQDAEMLAALSFKTFWDAFHDHPKNARHDLDAYMSFAFSVEKLTEELADPNAIFLVAEIEGKDVGYAKLLLGNREPGITGERPVELCRLYSRTEFLGQGVGAKLMDECLRVSAAQNCDAMWLGVWEFNPRAQKFYRKYGFEVVGSHTFQLGSDPQTDLLMQREIPV